MKLKILFLLLIICSCDSEEKIRNTVEARYFLANNVWETGTRDRIEFTEQEVTIKRPSGSLTYDKQSSPYSIIKVNGGDSIMKSPYFEVKWFDSVLNDYRKFLLGEDGSHSYISPDWRWDTAENVGKVIVHISDDEALQKENEYQAYYSVYEAASTESAKRASADVANLFQGTQVFCDTSNEWYYIVSVDGDNINLHLFSGIYNKDGDHSNPKEIIAGRVEDGGRIITKSEDGNDTEIFMYSGEKLDVLGYEESVSSFKRCD